MAKIFVYGTLLEGCRNYLRYLDGHVHQIMPAYVKGTLYSLKGRDYPALLPGSDFILGEVMEADDEVIPAIDQLEGYVPGDPDNEYEKVSAQIYDEEKQPLCTLPVYMYNIDRSDQRELIEARIISNDYRKWLSSRAKME